MDFDNHFAVDAPLESVWAFMLKAEEVAPCVPGAQLTETLDETHFQGTVKIKLGAVQMTYRGELEMEADEASHRIVLHAKGTEMRGSGGATGTFTTVLSPGNDGETLVDIHSAVDITGRVAQFGRSIMQDVGNRLIREFANCLEQKLKSQGEAHDIAKEPTVASGPTSAELQPSLASVGTNLAPPGNELRLQSLVLEVVRSRTAAALRALASRIEPK
ncbi:MAG TPA: SRPBCC family protein [Chloroflexota bacterium]